MSWRCAWCWTAGLPDEESTCFRCGRDIEAVEKPAGPGRPRIAEPEWDGVVMHNQPGVRGYRGQGCRCPECVEAMHEVWAADRERKARRKVMVSA